MKLRNFFIAAVAGLFGLAACEGLEQDLGVAKISIDPLELTFPKEESSLQVTIIATRDWSVTSALPEWIALSATEGKASANAQTISVTVEKNDGNDREAAIVITAGMVRATLTVKQAGAKGEIQKGDGTKENPYSVAGVLEYLGTLGADVNSPDKVYVQGKVASIKEAFSAQYGNSTFDITDDGVVSDTKFTAYRVLYLGNKKWAEGNAQIQVGDDVILYGNVVNFKGNTPETQQGSAFLYSLNGQNEGGDNGGGSSSGTTAEPAGDGSQANPFNVAAAIAKAKEVGETATTESYYIKGKVSTVKEAFGAQYGNGTFELVDEGYTAVFTAFRILYLGNQKWVEGNSSVAVGDEIVVVGKIVNFKGNTPETSQGSGYLYSLNGQTGGGDQPGPVEETTAEAAGDGSQANPFNVAAAIAKAKEVGETATTESYYIKGKVSTVKEAFGAQYGNGTFELVDEGYTAVFTAFRILYFGNQKWAEGNSSVAVGDEIVVVGKIVNFKGNTPETSQGSGYLYSLNGQTGGSDQPGPGGDETPSDPKGTGTQADPYNAAAANEAASALEAGAKSDEVYVSGKISSIKYQFDAAHGTATFNISDDGTTSGSQFTCYSVLYLENKAWVTGYSEVKVGDAVVICGKLTNYQGNTPETASKEAYIYSLNGVTEAGEPTQGGDPTTGDDTTYASNVTWTLGSNAYDNVSSKVNGVAGVKTLKLGTGSKYGDATLKIPAGATKLTFYAVSWNNADAATLVFSVDGTEIGKANPVANSGLKGTSTYELTVTDSDKFEIAVTGGTDVKVETTGGYRAALFAVHAE